MRFPRARETFKKHVIARVPRKDRADVLLVYPIWVKRGGRGKLQRMLPPLGILSIAAYLEQHGYEVHVVDLHAEELSPARFRAIVRALRPRFVGVTVLSAHYVPAHHIARICKDEVPDCKVYVGGVHAEAAPEQMLQNPAVDAVCRGDGEETMLELVRGVPYDAIPGLSHRRGGRVAHNPPREVAMDLDAYPFPAYHLVDLDHYFPPAGSYRDLPAVNVLMTRGCPGRCTFCNSATTPLRARSVARMVELIKVLRYDHGIREVYFYDDTFTAQPQRVREFCHAMIADKVDVKWICYVRGDMFNDAHAELMARAGCHQVLMGVESGSAELMAKIGKPIRKDRYVAAVATAHRYGIEVRASFIIGHLAETHATMRETVEFAKEINADFFQLSVMTPYPGTQLFREARRRGLLLHEDYARYGQSELVMKLDTLGPAEVLAFERRAFYEFYLRPIAIWRQLKRLRNPAQVRDLVKAAYILLGEGLGAASEGAPHLQAWLTFEVLGARPTS
jgi:anaerobic magnesium-protoporphyrin IX monomethyl ester cyclase